MINLCVASQGSQLVWQPDAIFKRGALACTLWTSIVRCPAVPGRHRTECLAKRAFCTCTMRLLNPARLSSALRRTTARLNCSSGGITCGQTMRRRVRTCNDLTTSASQGDRESTAVLSTIAPVLHLRHRLPLLETRQKFPNDGAARVCVSFVQVSPLGAISVQGDRSRAHLLEARPVHQGRDAQ